MKALLATTCRAPRRTLDLNINGMEAISAWLWRTLGKSIKTGRLRGLEVKRYEAPTEHVRSGNIVIKDVALWKKP